MRMIVNVFKKTEGRPSLLEAPEGGWTYRILGELGAGLYHVELGKHVEQDAESDLIPDDEIAAGHTFAILARSSSAWDKQVNALLRTVEKQGELIAKLYAQLEKVAGGEKEGNLLETLQALAPAVKALLAAPKEEAKK